MSDIILCNKPISANTLSSQCGIDTDTIFGMHCTNPTMLNAYTPYILGENPSPASKSIVNQLTTSANNRELTNVALSFGGDNTIAIAEMTAKLKEFNVGVMGASTSIYANRVGGFADAVKSYQDALMEYRQAIETKSPVKAAAKQKAFNAFQKMQRDFHFELKSIKAANKSRRGIPLTNSNRALNIAESSRDVAKLNVTSQAQASNLVKFSQYSKFLGNGLAVIDFGSRVGNIHNSYKAGQNWERQMFIESTSFTASALTGAAVVKAGGAALSFIMVATPVGWVGLILGGVAVVGVTAAASIGMNSAVKDNSGDWYDSIMDLLGIK